LIVLPKGNTIIQEEKDKNPIYIRPYESLSYKYDIGHSRNIFLEKIDINRLIKGKKSSKNEGYKLDELKTFARNLGINVNQNKDDLVDAIKELKISSGSK